MKEVHIHLTADEIAQAAEVLGLHRSTIALFAADLERSANTRRWIEGALHKCVWSHPADFLARMEAAAWLLASPIGADIRDGKHRADPFTVAAYNRTVRPLLAQLCPPLKKESIQSPRGAIHAILKYRDKTEGTNLAAPYRQAWAEIADHNAKVNFPVSAFPAPGFRRASPTPPARFDGAGNSGTADSTQKREESPISPNSPAESRASL